MKISMKPRRFAVKSVSPRMRPSKIRKNTCKIKPAFSASNAYGKTMYTATPNVVHIKPNRR